MAPRLVQLFFGAALVTLPFCGVGTLVLLTGRDWGFGLQPSWVFLYLAVACQIWNWRRLRGSSALPRPRRRSLAAAGLLILAAVAVSGAGLLVAPSAEPPVLAWTRFGKQAVQLAIMLGFLIFPATWVRGEQRWGFTLRLLGVGLVLQVVYGGLQVAGYGHWGGAPPWLESVFTSNPAILSGSGDLYLGNTFHQVPRLRGTMCEPLYLGNFLLFALPWLMGQGGGVWRGRILPPLGGALLLMTWSRGAWLAAAGQGALLAWWAGRSWRGRARRPVAVAGALGVLSLLAFFLFSDLAVFQLPRDRLLQTCSTRDWSNLTRFYSMQAGWRAFLLSPLVGVGWGQFSFHFPLLVDPLGLQSQFTWPVVNNFFLKVLCETGLVGFGVMAGLLAGLVRAGRRSARRGGAAGRRSRAGLVALAGVGLQLLTFSQYNLPHMWLAAGLLLAAARDPEPDPAGGKEAP